VFFSCYFVVDSLLGYNSSMRRAIFRGAFDPLTNGHLDIIKRSARLFSEMMGADFNNQTMPVPVIKTIASQKKGIEELTKTINEILHHKTDNEKRYWLLAEKAYHLIQKKRMKDINKENIKTAVKNAGNDFNLYRFIKNYR